MARPLRGQLGTQQEQWWTKPAVRSQCLLTISGQRAAVQESSGEIGQG